MPSPWIVPDSIGHRPPQKFTFRPTTMVDPSSPRRGPSDYYFDSYSRLQIHEDMLKDTVRTLAYRDALTRNPSLVADKVILDVGCGTAILSMFAARAGARHVYAVENSSIVEQARLIVAENGLADKITIIQGVMEEVEIPEKVDMVVSEWMGYALLYESMLPSVIGARDRFLKVGGTMFPNGARMVVAGIDDRDLKRRKIDYWGNVYGFDFAPIRRWAFTETVVDVIDEDVIMTDDCVIMEFDLNSVTVAELSIQSEFDVWCIQDGEINGLVLWFDVIFDEGDETIELTTSPYEKSTHWSQTVFFFDAPINVISEECLHGTFEMKPNERNPRDQDFTVSYEFRGVKYSRQYKMR